MDSNPARKTPSSYNADALLACVEVGKALTSTYDIKEILTLIMEKVSELIDARNWSLLLTDAATGQLAFEITVGIDRDLVADVRIPLGEWIAGQVAQTGQMAIITDVAAAPGFSREIDLRTGFSTESIVCVPLQIHGSVLGVVELVNVADIEAFRSTKLPILNILGDYAAVAIENSRFFDKIKRMSITDEYTGLYNARYLHQILVYLIRCADDGGHAVTVAFVDVDNF